MPPNWPVIKTCIRRQATQAPLPINVEALHYAPLRLPKRYGDLTADIQLRSYGSESMDFYADFIIRTGYYLGIPLTGPKPLPTRRERWTVIKSPFVHAKKKENFERHTHKRLIKAWDTNPEVLNMWLAYITKHSIPGVGMKCNFFQQSPVSLDLAQDEKISESLIKDVEEQSDIGINSGNLNPQDTATGQRVLELLNSPEFKKYF